MLKYRSHSPNDGKSRKLSCHPSGSTWALSSIDSSHHADSPQHSRHSSRHNSHAQLRHTANESTNDLIYSPDGSPMQSPLSSKSAQHSECPGVGSPNINWARAHNEVSPRDCDGLSRLSRMSSRSSINVIEFVPEETEEEVVDFEADDAEAEQFAEDQLTMQLTLANMQANEEYCRQFSRSADDVSELTNEDGSSMQRSLPGQARMPVVKTARITRRNRGTGGRNSPSPRNSDPSSPREHFFGDEESSYGDEVQPYSYGVELFLEHASPPRKQTVDCCTSPTNPCYISPAASPCRGIANTSSCRMFADCAAASTSTSTSPLQHHYPEDVALVAMSRTGGNKNEIPLTLGMTERRSPREWIGDEEAEQLKQMALKQCRVLVGWQVLLLGPDGTDLGTCCDACFETSCIPLQHPIERVY